MTAATATTEFTHPASAPRTTSGIAAGLIGRAVAVYRRHRNRRQLMQMSDLQRADVGLGHIDVRSACDLSAAARRQLELGMPTAWR